MDGRLRLRIREVADQLAHEESERLEAAGKLVDLERLTAEIGDELARQVARKELSRRAEQAAAQPLHACPDCGRECEVEPEREPLILQGIRGEIEYLEPRCFCPRCRRAFFPSGANAAASGA